MSGFVFTVTDRYRHTPNFAVQNSRGIHDARWIALELQGNSGNDEAVWRGYLKTIKSVLAIGCSLVVLGGGVAHGEEPSLNGDAIPKLELKSEVAAPVENSVGQTVDAQTSTSLSLAPGSKVQVTQFDALLLHAVQQAVPEKKILLERSQIRDIGKRRLVQATALGHDNATLERVEVTPDRLRVKLTLMLPDARAIEVQGQCAEAIEAPVITHRLTKGDTITAADVEVKEVAKRELRKDSITDVTTLIGKQATRLLDVGRIPQSRDIQAEIVLHKGKQVRAYFVQPGIEMQTLVEALEDAGRGDTVRVKNLESGLIVKGQVQENGSVLVSAGNAPQQPPTQKVATPVVVPENSAVNTEEAPAAESSPPAPQDQHGEDDSLMEPLRVDQLSEMGVEQQQPQPAKTGRQMARANELSEAVRGIVETLPATLPGTTVTPDAEGADAAVE